MGFAEIGKLRGWSDELTIVAVILAIKVLLWSYGWMSYHVLQPTFTIDRLAVSVELWNRWDAPHYLAIAQSGYPRTGDLTLLAFFPLYPLLVRGVDVITRNFLASALLVSGIATIIAGLELYRLARIDYSRSIAFTAVMFMFLFPTSYFLHIGYTESTFLAFVLATFLALRHDRWLTAGVSGMFAALTHIHGVLLFLVFATETWIRWRQHRYLEWRWLISGMLVVVGLLTYMLWNYHLTGDPLTFLHIQHKWLNYPVPPWQSLSENWDIVRHYGNYDSQIMGVQVLFFITVVSIAIIVSLFYMRLSYTVWMAATLLIFICQSWDINAPREVLCMFPLFILMGMLSQSRTLKVILTTWAILSLGTFAGQFAAGRWAY